MEKARMNLVEKLSNMIQDYTNECLKIKEKEKANESIDFSFLSQDTIDTPVNDIDDDLYFSSFDKFKKIYKHSKSRNEKFVNFLDDLNNGKYDDVFMYYNFKRDLQSSRNNSKEGNLNLESYIPEDYPLIKKREQRKDIEMIPDPQMVLNFPTVSSLSEKFNSLANTSRTNTAMQQEHSVEIPLRKSISEKRNQGPSIKNMIRMQNNENIELKANESMPIIRYPPKIILSNIKPNQSSLSQKIIQEKPAPQQYSQPITRINFLDLYPPDPPQVFPPPRNISLFNKRNSPNQEVFNNSNENHDVILPSPSNEGNHKVLGSETSLNTSKINNNFQQTSQQIIKQSNSKSQIHHFLSSNSSMPTDYYESDSFPSPVISPNRRDLQEKFLKSSISTSNSINSTASQPKLQEKSFNSFTNPEKQSSNIITIEASSKPFNLLFRPNESTNSFLQKSSDDKSVANQDLPNPFAISGSQSNPFSVSQKVNSNYTPNNFHNSSATPKISPNRSPILNKASDSSATQQRINPFVLSEDKPNPFLPKQFGNSPSSLSSAPFKPILTSPAANSFHYISSTSDSGNSNSSTSANSSHPMPLTQFSSVDPASSLQNNNNEDDYDDQDSIIEDSSSNESSSVSTQKPNENFEASSMKPIITGKDIIQSEVKKFLSDDDVIQSENEINSSNEKQKQNTLQSQNGDTQISNDNKLPENDTNKNSSENKQSGNNSSSDFDESNLSQNLQQSGFIFEDNTVHSLGSMVQTSENPYMKLDSITRLPIKK